MVMSKEAEQGQYERALAIWRRLAELNPTRNLFLRLGRLTHTLGITDEAEQAVKRALEIDARCAIALRSLGIIAIHRSDYETAVGLLQRDRDIKEDPGGLSLLGVAFRNTGRDLEAEEAYRTAIRIDADYEEAHFNLGALLRDDRPSEAEAEGHLRKAVKLAPEDVWAHIYLGACLWKKDVRGAETEFRMAEKLRPAWSMPLSWLGKLYESKDLETAQSFFERALQLEVDDWEALCGLARLFKKRGQNDLARECITRALIHDPTDEKSLALLEGING
jgi:protein O-GlcNAc transferase